MLRKHAALVHKLPDAVPMKLRDTRCIDIGIVDYDCTGSQVVGFCDDAMQRRRLRLHWLDEDAFQRLCRPSAALLRSASSSTAAWASPMGTDSARSTFLIVICLEFNGTICTSSLLIITASKTTGVPVRSFSGLEIACQAC